MLKGLLNQEFRNLRIRSWEKLIEHRVMRSHFGSRSHGNARISFPVRAWDPDMLSLNLVGEGKLGTNVGSWEFPSSLVNMGWKLTSFFLHPSKSKIKAK